jgi:hypothetical protein
MRVPDEPASKTMPYLLVSTASVTQTIVKAAKSAKSRMFAIRRKCECEF